MEMSEPMERRTITSTFGIAVLFLLLLGVFILIPSSSINSSLEPIIEKFTFGDSFARYEIGIVNSPQIGHSPELVAENVWDRFKISSSSNQRLNASMLVESDGEDYNILLSPENGEINLTILSADIALGSELKIDSVLAKPGFARVYAIDPTALQFSNATVSTTAQGTRLFKCASWNFSQQECVVTTTCEGEGEDEICEKSGGWVFLQDITPGENYEFLLTADDPGFGEASPDNGTADAADREWITSAYTTEYTEGSYTDTWADDTSYYCTGYDNAVSPSANNWLTYFDFDISALSVTAKWIYNLTFDWKGYSGGWNSVCTPGTNDDPECVGNGNCRPSYIRIYNWSSGVWNRFSSTSYTMDGNWDTVQQSIIRTVQGITSDWINQTSNTIRIAFEHNETGMTNNYETKVATDYVLLTVNYNESVPPIVRSVTQSEEPLFRYQTLNITANITDNYGVDSAWVVIGSDNCTMTNVSQDIYQCLFNTDDLTIGGYNYTIYANDINGTVSNPYNGTFNISVAELTDPLRSGSAFFLYVPPLHNNTVSDPENPLLVITAFNDNTSVTIEDMDGDGDSDDSKGNSTNPVILDRGQSKVVFISEGSDLDDDDGDYFYIESSNTITAVVQTQSAWTAHTVAAEGRDYSGEEFFVYSRRDVPQGTNMDLVVFGHENDTHIRIYDITGDNSTTDIDGLDANDTTVVVEEGTVIDDVILDKGEHISFIGDSTHIAAGSTWRIVSNKRAGVIVGTFTQDNQGRDGGFYVGGVDGKTASTEFYTFVSGGVGGVEDEMYFFGTEDTNITVQALDENGTINQTFTLLLNVTNNYYNTLLETGADHYRHVTATSPISILAGSWLRDGTGDVADFAPALTGSGIGQEFKIYVPEPAGRGYTNAIMFSYYNDTYIEVYNASDDSFLGNNTLDYREHWNFNLTTDALLYINATNNIGIEVTNYDDNVAFTAVSLPLRKITITKSSDDDEVDIGDYIRFEINVSNEYAVDFFDISIIDIMENGLVLINSTEPSGVSTPLIENNTPRENSTRLTWNISLLSGGETKTFIVYAQVNSTDLVQKNSVEGSGTDEEGVFVGGSDVGIIFLTDETEPVIVGAMETPDPQTLNYIVNITANVTDSWWVTTVLFDVNGTNYTATKGDDDKWYYEYNGTVLGTFNYSVYAFDSSNNSAESQGYDFTIVTEATPPTINSVSDTPDPVNQSDNNTITANVTDNVGVDAVLCEIEGVNYTMTYDDCWSVNANLEADDNATFDGGYASSTNCICPSSQGGDCLQESSTWVAGAFSNITYTSDLPNGTFDITYYVCPEDDGDDVWNVYSTNGSLLDNYTTAGGETWYSRTITGVTLEESDDLRFSCARGSASSYCRMDYFVINGANGTCLWNLPHNTSLEAGVVNYTVYANDTVGNDATPLIGNYTVLTSATCNVSMANLTLNPDLNISYFGLYNYTANVLNQSEVSFVNISYLPLNADGVSCYQFYEDGSCARSSAYVANISYVNGTEWYYSPVYPDEIYPKISFATHTSVWNSPRNITSNYKGNYEIMNFVNNFTITDGTSFWIELDAFADTDTDRQLQVYLFDNSTTISDFSSEWFNSSKGEVVATINPADSKDHTHSSNSSHHVIQITAGDNGTIGEKNLGIAGSFWLVLYSSGDSSEVWNVSYRDGNICNTSSWWKGNSSDWNTSLQTTGCPDVQVDFVRYNVSGQQDRVRSKSCAKLSCGVSECTDNVHDYYVDLAQLPPVANKINVPVENMTYACPINISWNPFEDPNGDSVNYSVSLLYPNGTFVQEAGNTSEDFLYWNCSSVSDGDYRIKVNGSDPDGNTDYSIMDGNFTIDNTAPQINSVSPNGTEYNVSSIPVFSMNVTEATGCILASGVNMTTPNGTLITIDLSDVNGDGIYNGTYPHPLLKGRHNLTFFVEDCAGNTANLTTWFDRIVPGNKIIDVIDKTYEYKLYNYSVIGNSSGILDIKLTMLQDHPIREIIVEGYNASSPRSVIIVENDTEEDLCDFYATYAVDPTYINHSKINMTVTARGNFLYKCENFNITTELCNDFEDYTQLAYGLTVGQNYSVTIEGVDPGFGETLEGPENLSDSWIRGGAPDTSYGGLEGMRVGRTTGSNNIRGLLWFNLSSIPDGVQIDNAYVSMHLYRIPSGDSNASRTHGLYRVQQSPSRDWDENTVTWNNYTQTTAWTTPGADYASTASATASVGVNQVGSWVNWTVTSDIADFYVNGSNYGWVIKDSLEDTDFTRRDYFASECSCNTTLLPRLFVNYTDITPPVTRIIAPANGSSFDENSTVLITINVTDNTGSIDKVLLNVTWEDEQRDFEATYNSSSGLYYVYFTNTTFDLTSNVRYNMTAYANDSTSLWSNNATGYFIVTPIEEHTYSCTVERTPHVAEAGETVLVQASISRDGAPATSVTLPTISTSIIRVSGGSTTSIESGSMSYLLPGLWSYEFDTSPWEDGNYATMISALSNDVIPVNFSCSAVFSISGRGLFSLMGITPSLVEANSSLRLGITVTENEEDIDASLIQDAHVTVTMINGTNQTFNYASLTTTNGLVYADGFFDEPGTYYLNWSVTYYNRTKTLSEMLVVVDYGDYVGNLNVTNVTELRELIVGNRDSLLNVLTELERSREFDEEEVFLVTDAASSMTKIVKDMDDGKLSMGEAESRFASIQAGLSDSMGDKISGRLVYDPKDLEIRSCFRVGPLCATDWLWIIVVLVIGLAFFRYNVAGSAYENVYEPVKRVASKAYRNHERRAMTRRELPRRYELLFEGFRRGIGERQSRSRNAMFAPTQRGNKRLGEFFDSKGRKIMRQLDVQSDLSVWGVIRKKQYVNEAVSRNRKVNSEVFANTGKRRYEILIDKLSGWNSSLEAKRRNEMLDFGDRFYRAQLKMKKAKSSDIFNKPMSGEPQTRFNLLVMKLNDYLVDRASKRRIRDHDLAEQRLRRQLTWKKVGSDKIFGKGLPGKVPKKEVPLTRFELLTKKASIIFADAKERVKKMSEARDEELRRVAIIQLGKERTAKKSFAIAHRVKKEPIVSKISRSKYNCVILKKSEKTVLPIESPDKLVEKGLKVKEHKEKKKHLFEMLRPAPLMKHGSFHYEKLPEKEGRLISRRSDNSDESRVSMIADLAHAHGVIRSKSAKDVNLNSEVMDAESNKYFIPEESRINRFRKALKSRAERLKKKSVSSNKEKKKVSRKRTELEASVIDAIVDVHTKRSSRKAGSKTKTGSGEWRSSKRRSGRWKRNT